MWCRFNHYYHYLHFNQQKYLLINQKSALLTSISSSALSTASEKWKKFRTPVGTIASFGCWLKRIFALLRIRFPRALEGSESKPVRSIDKISKNVVSNTVEVQQQQQSQKRKAVEDFSSEPESNPVQKPSRSLSTPSSFQQLNNMHRSAVQFAAQVRTPMIKFIGARLPRPHFDPAMFPPIQASSAAAVSSATPPSSSPPIGKIPRGQGIEEWQLPPYLRRQPISEEECAMINSGGAYAYDRAD